MLGAHGRPDWAPALSLAACGGHVKCDSQADMSSAKSLWAQLVFKDLMVHEILQFTPSSAFRYVIHRCESRYIHCQEPFVFTQQRASPLTIREWGARGRDVDCSIPWRFPRRGSFVDRRACAPRATKRRRATTKRRLLCLKRVRGSFCCAGFDNDPSEGSPTETLLRLLLPLNDKVEWTSHDIAGSEPPTSPRSKHFTGSFNR